MTPKEERAFLLAAMFRITYDNGLWHVPSQNTPGKFYHVNLQLGTCTCADHEKWAEPCKHMIAAELVAQREGAESKLVMDLKASIEKAHRPTYKQNWSAYNQAQTIEKDRFQALLFDLAKLASAPEQRKTGRPRVPVSDVVFATVFKVYSTLSTRRFASDLRAAHKAGYISRPLHYNSICAYFEWKELSSVLVDLIQKSCLPLKAVETDFAVDSSGFSTSRFVRWFDEKYRVHRRGHDWVKAHIMTGVRTNIVSAIEIHHRDAGDAPLFKPLLQATAKTFDVKEVSADGAYLSVANLELTAQHGATPYIPFQPDNSPDKGGLWEKMLNYYRLHREDFLKHYHKRSNVESTFSMIKAKFRDHVRSRTNTAMKNEVLCKVLAHNICCVIQSQIELGVEASFWPHAILPFKKPDEPGDASSQQPAA